MNRGVKGRSKQLMPQNIIQHRKKLKRKGKADFLLLVYHGVLTTLCNIELFSHSEKENKTETRYKPRITVMNNCG
jgi:hypothetical protein